ncbi:hypothetical protein O3P69_017871 [Scylla paramamosain]|uniref:Peptidase S1 domain-containing protein n=1 Tax=Scylla paramamosain TaxID=85552 RepID=A0AAW0TH75_SCYPA
MVIGLVLWVVRALIGQYCEEGVAIPLQDLTFNMYRSLVVQSNRLPALLWPLRLVFAGWYLYCFYNAFSSHPLSSPTRATLPGISTSSPALYSGTLTAVLALPVYEKPIDSLADLLEASKQGFYPVTIKEISIDFLFQVAIFLPAAVPDNSCFFVFTSTGRDNFYLGRQSFFPQTYGIACMKGADYRKHFDRVLERLVQSGLVEKYKRDEFLKLGGRITGGGGKRRGQTSAITITHLQGAFFLYVIGVTLALAVLLGSDFKVMAVRRLLPLVVCLVCYVAVTGGRGDGRKDGGGAGGEGGGAAAQIRNIFGVATEEAATTFSPTRGLHTSGPRTPRLWWALWPFKRINTTATTTTITSNTTTSKPLTNLIAISPTISVPSSSSQVSVCGLSGRVVGGNDVKEGALPWAVGVRDKRNITYCGGALITPRHVLTAAHCMAGDPSKFPLHVSIGEQRALPRRTVRVTHALYHSDFGKTSTFDSDLGVLLLEERIDPFPATPCLPEMDREVPEGVAVTVVGWGATSEDGNISSVLKEAELDVLPKGSCIDAYSSNFNPNKMICAGKLNGAADACQGDSGGPLIQRGEREEEEEKAVWVVVGVVSFGNGCGRPGFPGAYTRTSAFLPWLKKVLLLYP